LTSADHGGYSYDTSVAGGTVVGTVFGALCYFGCCALIVFLIARSRRNSEFNSYSAMGNAPMNMPVQQQQYQQPKVIVANPSYPAQPKVQVTVQQQPMMQPQVQYAQQPTPQYVQPQMQPQTVVMQPQQNVQMQPMMQQQPMMNNMVVQQQPVQGVYVAPSAPSMQSIDGNY